MRSSSFLQKMIAWFIIITFLSSLIGARTGLKPQRQRTYHAQDLRRGARLRYSYPFQDPTLPWEKRVEDLVGRLTLDELVNQTITIYTRPTFGIPRLGVKDYVWISECLRGQIGYNGTAFPQSLGLAAAFDPGLVYHISEAVSYEVRAHWNDELARGLMPHAGLSCFSPVINIMRHPLWGRNQETYGEDPYLASRLAKHFVVGLQGEHPRYVRANAGCKHFDVHGGPENIPVTRFSFDAKVSTRDWRMTFLPAFQACVDAGTYSLMCSYNRINGIPACANGELLTNISRAEWGFRGYVVSDAGAISNMIDFHKYVKDPATASADSLRAGCNLELGSTIFQAAPEAIQRGLLTEAILRERVKPLFYTRMRLGEFDPPGMNPYTTINMSVVQSQQHQKLARLAAMRSFVLLKNQRKTLPLVKDFKKVAVVGPMSNNAEQLYGDYAPLVSKTLASTPWKSLAKLAPKASQADGCENTACGSYNSTSLKLAIVGADLIIVCLGTGQSVESEGRDRADLTLPGHQLDLLKDAASIGSAAGARVIVLLFNAGPLDVTWAKLSPSVDAMLACFFPAQATGDALYETLTAKSADAVPAGRLPATWPAYLSQVPPITDYTMVGRTYRYYEGDPLYSFGYGLSYTSFSYVSLDVMPRSIHAGGDVNVTVRLRNTGNFDADEVVQVYLKWPSGNKAAPKIQLVGFWRVRIQQGQQSTVTLPIAARQMAVWLSDTAGFQVLPGLMKVFAGGQQPNQRTSVPSNVLSGEFQIM